MNAPNRNFVAQDAKREHTPLLVGLMGPSGSGKTYSAHRLAQGIQSVVGGDIYMIDTENRRGLHYADRFTFKHVDMQPPFGSLDYLKALEFCVGEGAKTIIVDSMSHEHEGPGGMIDFHEQEVTRMAKGEDWKRQAVQMLAWSEPKQRRRQLINGMIRLNANIICCFRAKMTSKPVKKDGKTEVEQLGFMPIAGDEFVYEQTLNCLLLPGAGGVPTWHSEQVGERTMIKLPEQFRTWLSDKQQPLDETVGAGLARWAAGMERPKKAEPAQEGLPV
jgi:ABC-type dipeptide/oligopeptide/nickel transport system ATPase subunit